MEEQLISFETAKLAKEKGFDWDVYALYDYEGGLVEGMHDIDFTICDWNKERVMYNGKDISNETDITYSAPTQSLLQKWIREEKNIQLHVIPVDLRNSKYGFFWAIKNSGVTNAKFKVYEEALEEGLQEALKLLNQ